MPRIEPIPLGELTTEVRRAIEDGLATGVYSTPVPAQIFAYRTARVLADKGATPPSLGSRLLELLRIRSAQVSGCDTCMMARKHPSITDQDVACLVASSADSFTERESLALGFLELLATHHHAVDDETYRALARAFTTAEIIDLGFVCAGLVGIHRFLHTLDLLSDSEPAIRYDPTQVDSSRAEVLEA